MEEINVAQNVEQAVEETVLPNNNTINWIGLGIVGIGLVGLGYLGYKGSRKLIDKFSKSKQSDGVVVVEVQTETEEATEE